MSHGSHSHARSNQADIDPSRRPGFRSFKTVVPIRYPARWHRDLLIQLTLDPFIKNIGPDVGDDVPDGGFGLTISVHSRQVRLLALRDEAPNVDRSTPNWIVIRRSTVLAEPTVSNGREIWSARRTRIPSGVRMALLKRLESHTKGIKLGEAAEMMESCSVDPFEALFGLACAGLVIVDLRPVLSPDTIVQPSDATVVDNCRTTASEIGRLLHDHERGARSQI